MRVGESAFSLERPLSVHLGPGLLGEIYDGIQRPLEDIKKIAGGSFPPASRSRRCRGEEVALRSLVARRERSRRRAPSSER